MTVISTTDPRAEDVRALLTHHLAFIGAHSAPEDDYSLGLDELADPAVTLFALREDGELLGVAALKRLDDTHAEIKSMHTAAAARGRGVGRALVDHLLTHAREQGYARVSLETGSGAGFAGARALYAATGFEECGPFADYAASPECTFMSRSLV